MKSKKVEKPSPHREGDWEKSGVDQERSGLKTVALESDRPTLNQLSFLPVVCLCKLSNLSRLGLLTEEPQSWLGALLEMMR